MRKTKAFLLIFIAVQSLNAAAVEAYYGKEIAAKEHELSNVDLKDLLYKVVSGAHVQQSGQPDQIFANCPTGKSCLQQKSLGYDGARRMLFGRLFLTQGQNGYEVEDIYCSRKLTSRDFPNGKGPAPDKIPDNNVVNAEHSWPQSKFSGRFPAGLQKADIHILFSTSSRANSLRGNDPFGDVITTRRQVCPESALGYTSRGNSNFFLPPANVRGDLARAVFYFSVRYQMRIDPEQEEAIRHWNQQDPVDQIERNRHEQKFQLVQNRNPFIDHSDWVNMIQDF